jgi:hypothetical protein
MSGIEYWLILGALAAIFWFSILWVATYFGIGKSDLPTRNLYLVGIYWLGVIFLWFYLAGFLGAWF